MKIFQQTLVMCFLIVSISLLFFAAFTLSSKLFETSSVLFAVTGLIQLELTGFFDIILKDISDTKKYPKGPPSSITREIIDNPDRPCFTYLKCLLFYKRKFGLTLLFVSSFIQLVSIWLKDLQ